MSLTTYRGDERDPAFSPDGTQVAFSWGPEGGVTNTYVKLIGPGEPIRLTKSPYTERTPMRDCTIFSTGGMAHADLASIQ